MLDDYTNTPTSLSLLCVGMFIEITYNRTNSNLLADVTDDRPVNQSNVLFFKGVTTKQHHVNDHELRALLEAALKRPVSSVAKSGDLTLVTFARFDDAVAAAKHFLARLHENIDAPFQAKAVWGDKRAPALAKAVEEVMTQRRLVID